MKGEPSVSQLISVRTRRHQGSASLAESEATCQPAHVPSEDDSLHSRQSNLVGAWWRGVLSTPVTHLPGDASKSDSAGSRHFGSCDPSKKPTL